MNYKRQCDTTMDNAIFETRWRTRSSRSCGVFLLHAGFTLESHGQHDKVRTLDADAKEAIAEYDR